MLHVTKEHNGTTVELHVGDPLQIELAENPTTGYRWQLPLPATPLLELQNDSFEVPTTACGAGGLRRWRFLAAQAGTAKIEMEHRRSWEKSAVEKFTLTVEVAAQDHAPEAQARK